LKAWVPLYGMTWLVLVQFLTLMLAPRGSSLAIDLHILVGVGIIALAFVNMKNVQRTAAPARTKRIARAAFTISLGGGAIGVLLLFNIAPSVGLFRGGFLYVLHLMAAFAVITQAASTATSFDMWQEREFEAPGPHMDAEPAPSVGPSRAI
jgi:hypothetical protein